MWWNNTPTVRRLILAAVTDDPRSPANIARSAGISATHLNQIIEGHARLGAGIAVKLEVELGVPAEELLIAQAVEDAAMARAVQRTVTTLPQPREHS